MLLVEQNVGQSLEIAHRAYVLENGGIVFHGTPAGAPGQCRSEAAYLGL